jgi:hypothetical protein
MRSVLILICSSLILVSCTKNQNQGEKYTTEEFAHLASSATAVNPTGENVIPFFDYSPGVNKTNSKTLIFERLKFFAVEFETDVQAKNEAIRLNQYYARNYLLDRVEGEPILEDYVIATFKGANPNRTIQRAPKKAEGHSGHEAEHNPHETAHPTHQ